MKLFDGEVSRAINRYLGDSIFSKLTSLYLISLFTVFLFYCGESGYQGLVESKYILFLIINGGYILITLFAALELIVIGKIELPNFKCLLKKASYAQKFIVLYLLMSIISTLTSNYGKEAMLGMTRYEGLLTIMIYGITFLFVSSFIQPKQWMIYLWGVVALLFATLCITQLFGKNPFDLYPKGLTYHDAYIAYSGAYIGTTGNVDLTAALLCLIIPSLLIAVLRLERRNKYWLFLPLSMSLVVMLKIDVDAGLVGVLLSTLIIVPVAVFRKKHLKVIFLSVLGVFFLIAIGLLYFFDPGFSFLHELHEILHGKILDTFGSGRMYIWRNVLEHIPNNLLFGTGPDTMIAANIEPFSRYSNEYGMIYSYIDVAHNEYLNILYHQGFFSLLFYLTALISSAIRWIRRSADDIVVAICGSAVLGYSIQAFFGFSMCITAPFMWVAWAMLEHGAGTKGSASGNKR